MTVRLDHTIVPAKDKIASAGFFAEIFGLTVKPGQGYFAQVQVNESLTLDFADEPEPWGGPGFDPSTVPDPTLDQNLEIPSGRGLMLMRAYMTAVTFNPAGNRVTMRYRKPPGRK